jgi:tRNA(Ile)-lysidine synthase
VGKHEALETLGTVTRESGLVDAWDDGVVLVSGGPDSACAAAGLTTAIGARKVHALHVNYGLRDTADRDERVCRDLCAQLRIDLHVERPKPAELEGNLQAKAREIRYAAAERLRQRTGGQWIATGHTRSDQAETLVYRLAVSPGSRALLGLAPRSGRIIRPLLGLSRADTRALATEAGLRFADDPTNDDFRFARNRVRGEVMPTLAELSSHAERNITETRAEMVEEAALLELVALEALEAAGAGADSLQVDASVLATWEPALRRIALRMLAERAVGRPVPLGRPRAAQIARLAADPEGGEVQLPGGVSAICERGIVRFAPTRTLDAAPAPAAVGLALPGSARIGGWEVRAELRPPPVDVAGPDLATLDARSLGGPLEVRTWREGDRMRPLGMTGTKTLQDLFTDRKVPRTARAEIPVVTAGGQVAWVAGVAVADDFRISSATSEVAVLTAHTL